MHKENVVHIQWNTIQLLKRREFAICDNMGEPGGDKLNKSEKKKKNIA